MADAPQDPNAPKRQTLRISLLSAPAEAFFHQDCAASQYFRGDHAARSIPAARRRVPQSTVASGLVHRRHQAYSDRDAPGVGPAAHADRGQALRAASHRAPPPTSRPRRSGPPLPPRRCPASHPPCRPRRNPPVSRTRGRCRTRASRRRRRCLRRPLQPAASAPPRSSWPPTKAKVFLTSGKIEPPPDLEPIPHSSRPPALPVTGTLPKIPPRAGCDRQAARGPPGTFCKRQPTPSPSRVAMKPASGAIAPAPEAKGAGSDDAATAAQRGFIRRDGRAGSSGRSRRQADADGFRSAPRRRCAWSIFPLPLVPRRSLSRWMAARPRRPSRSRPRSREAPCDRKPARW